LGAAPARGWRRLTRREAPTGTASGR
jgi:hypothetical protein